MKACIGNLKFFQARLDAKQRHLQKLDSSHPMIPEVKNQILRFTKIVSSISQKIPNLKN